MHPGCLLPPVKFCQAQGASTPVSTHRVCCSLPNVDGASDLLRPCDACLVAERFLQILLAARPRASSVCLSLFLSLCLSLSGCLTACLPSCLARSAGRRWDGRWVGGLVGQWVGGRWAPQHLPKTVGIHLRLLHGPRSGCPATSRQQLDCSHIPRYNEAGCS